MHFRYTCYQEIHSSERCSLDRIMASLEAAYKILKFYLIYKMCIILLIHYIFSENIHPLEHMVSMVYWRVSKTRQSLNTHDSGKIQFSYTSLPRLDTFYRFLHLTYCTINNIIPSRKGINLSITVILCSRLFPRSKEIHVNLSGS